MEHDREGQDMEGELRRIEPILTEIIGRPTRWSGRVELTDAPDILGAKPFRCDIVINKRLVGQDERWRTLIHELLHSYSVGYNSPDYDTYRGWEEGVVEQLQRLLRQTVLARLGVVVREDVFKGVENNHPYNKYIVALEALQLALEQDGHAFDLSLLETPIRERIGLIMRLSRRLKGQEYNTFVRLFAACNVTLKEKW